MTESYGKYQDARNASWQCLIRHNVRALPVPMSKIFREEGIPIGRYCDNTAQLRESGLDWLMRNDGFTIRNSAGKIQVFFDEQCSPQRTRFTLAHELGHIYLGHLEGAGSIQYSARNEEPLETKDPSERAANIFASRLLAPACVLWRLGIHSPDDIAQLCQISMTAARFRAERMALLYQRDADWKERKGCSCFLQSPLEQQVLEQFEPYIKGLL
jgi:hypothetical protein